MHTNKQHKLEVQLLRFLKRAQKIDECGRTGPQPRSVSSLKPPLTSGHKRSPFEPTSVRIQVDLVPIPAHFGCQRRRRRPREKAASVNSSTERRAGAVSAASRSFTAIETSAGAHTRETPQSQQQFHVLSSPIYCAPIGGWRDGVWEKDQGWKLAIFTQSSGDAAAVS